MKIEIYFSASTLFVQIQGCDHRFQGVVRLKLKKEVHFRDQHTRKPI